MEYLTGSGTYVIIGNITSPDCKILASSVLDLNLRGLSNSIAAHRSPQRKERHTPHARSHRGSPRSPGGVRGAQDAASPSVPRPIPRATRSPAIPVSSPFPRPRRTGLQSKPGTRRHHLSPRSPRTAVPPWRLRPRFLGNSAACGLDAGLDFSERTCTSGSTGPRREPPL